MTGGADALLIFGAVLVIAAGVLVAVVSRRPPTRVAERRCGARVLRATPSHQRRPERLPAAASAGRVYKITDLPAAQQGARANGGRTP